MGQGGFAIVSQRRALVLLIFTISAALLPASAEDLMGGPSPAQVIDILAGDRLLVETEEGSIEVVALAGVASAVGDEEAMAFAASWLDGKSVWITRAGSEDPPAAVLHLSNPDGSMNETLCFNRMLLDAGYARPINNSSFDPYRTPPTYSTIYRDIAIRALGAPPVETVEDIADYLIESNMSERERAYAIYRWIAANIEYDAEGLFSGSYGDLSAEGLLRSRRSVCSGYTNLFEALANVSGLEAATIHGYSKGWGYEVGEPVGDANHAWNAVRIDGDWQLIDATWGAGYVDDSGRYVPDFEDYFFLTPPDQFIYRHLPEDPAWQLLGESLSLDEFENLAYLRPEFFEHGLVLTDERSILPAEGTLNVSLLAPDGVLVIARVFEGDLELDHTLAFSQRSGEEYEVMAAFPKPGFYILRIFARRAGDEGEYDWAMDYGVEAISGSTVSYPRIYGDFHTRGAHLFQPLEGRLAAGRGVGFSLIVPGAEDVAIICGEQFTTLAKDGDLFSGAAVLQGDTALAAARMPGAGSYEVMLGWGVG